MLSTTCETVTFSSVVQFEVIMFIEMLGSQKKMKRYNVINNQTMINLNDYDLFATKITRDAELHPQIVGHLPLEISRFTNFLLDHGATITTTLSSTHHRRLPLVQGDLEIPCKESIWKVACKVSGNGSNTLYRTVI